MLEEQLIELAVLLTQTGHGSRVNDREHCEVCQSLWTLRTTLPREDRIRVAKEIHRRIEGIYGPVTKVN